MKLEVGLVIGLEACGAVAQPPATAPAVAASCPKPALSCKDAVERIGEGAHLRDEEVTLAIGQCEQQGWSTQARKCVATAKVNADLVVCGNKYTLGSHGIFAEVMTSEKVMGVMAHFRDDMCACTSSACAQQVSDQMTKWGQEAAKTNGPAPHLSDDDVKHFTQLGEEMGKCMQKAMSQGSP